MNFKSARFERILFSAVLIFFALPPIFVSAPKEGVFSAWRFPSQQITLAAFSALILFYRQKSQFSDNFFPSRHINSTLKTRAWLHCFLYCLSAFVLLCAAAALFEFVAARFQTAPSGNVSLPKNAQEFIFCVTAYLCAAFYEETIYRFYLPKTVRRFFMQSCGVLDEGEDLQTAVEKIQKVSRADNGVSKNPLKCVFRGCRKSFFRAGVFFAEVFAIILFALAHRYLGIFAMLNSVSAAVILRVCFLRTRSLSPPVFAHCFYNLLMLFIFAR